MATRPIIQQVVIQGTGLERIQAAFDRIGASGEKAFEGVTNGARRAEAPLNNLQGSLQRIDAGLTRAAATARRFALALGFTLGIREIIRASDEFTRLDNRLKTVTDTTEEYNKAQEQLVAASKATGTSLDENSTKLVAFDVVLGRMGITVKEQIQFIDTLNKSALLVGTGTLAAAGATRQLTQAMARGVLRGDEYISIMENLPRFAQALADVLGTTTDKLVTFAETGALTGPVLLQALRKMHSEVDEEFKGITLTIEQELQNLSTSFTIWVGDANNATGATKVLAGAIRLLAENLDIAAIALGGLVTLFATSAVINSISVIIGAVAAVAGITMSAAAAAVGAVALLAGGLAYLALRTDAATEAANKHATALKEVRDAIRDLEAGADGAADKVEKLGKAHIAAAQDAVEQARREVAVQQAALVERLELLHGIEEAERILRSGEFRSPALDAANEQFEIAQRRLREIAGAVTRTTSTFEGTGKAVEETTAKIRVMHGTSIGATALIDAHGKIIRVTKGVGEEVDKNSKKYKELQENIQKAVDFIDAHEGASQRIFRGTEHAATILFDEMGRAITQVDMHTGAITDLGQGYQQYRDRVDAAKEAGKRFGEETGSAIEGLTEKQQELSDKFRDIVGSSTRSASDIKKSQTGLVTDLGNIWDSWTGSLERIDNTSRSIWTAYRDWFLDLVSKAVVAAGEAWDKTVSYVQATIAELQVEWEKFKEWLFDLKFVLGIGFTVETSLGELIEGFQNEWTAFEKWWNDHLNFPLPSFLDPVQIKESIDNLKEELGNAWDNLFSGAEIEAGTGRQASVFGGLLSSAQGIIGEIGALFEGLVEAIKQHFSVENALDIFDSMVEGAESIISTIKGKWEAFWSWLKGEERKANVPGVQPDLPGTMSQRMRDQGLPLSENVVDARVEIEPVTDVEAETALRALETEAGQAGTAAGDAFTEMFRMKLDQEEPSKNVLDVREFGFDTIIAQWNLTLAQLENGAKITLSKIGDLFKSIFSGGAEEGEEAQGTSAADGLINAFIEADRVIREVVAGTVNWVNAAFVLLSESVAGTWAGIAEGIQNSFVASQEAIASALESLKQSATDSSTSAGQAITTAFQSAVNSVIAAINSLVSAFQSGMNLIISAVNNAISRMKALEAAAKAAERAAKSAAAAGGSAGGGMPAGAFALGGRVMAAVQKLSMGGPVWGPGSSTSDSIWAKISRGEYVIQARAVAYYGQRLFDLLNKMKIPIGALQDLSFSMGGPVMPAPQLASGGSMEFRSSGEPTSALYLEMPNGEYVETTIRESAVEQLLRHTTGKQLRSLGKLPRGRP